MDGSQKGRVGATSKGSVEADAPRFVALLFQLSCGDLETTELRLLLLPARASSLWRDETLETELFFASVGGRLVALAIENGKLQGPARVALRR
mmetsp:Transcript_30248/g.64695  ORF Transcript_30248/g.64695 Transcript_30248/m.64695 type:complete len:93 (+) Transcript_30248:2443-2721(+)